MKVNESVASATEVANGMWGMTTDMSSRMGPVVLAAAVVGTNPGHTAFAVIDVPDRRRCSS